MKISFVIIAYNEEENIIDCLKSIKALKGLPLEHESIVVNDGSKDSTAELVRSYAEKDKSVKLIDQENKGRGDARFSGVLVARGELIATVDGDIILPTDWFMTCLKWMGEYDAVGGIAVPDGDVSYIYKRFKLKPKIVKGTTTITGSNGLYKRFIFSKINFDTSLVYGEDTDFNFQLIEAGYHLKSINGLVVTHKESKTFPTSIEWAYQNGIGAMSQFMRFKKLRLPDLAYFGFIGSISVSVLSIIFFGEWITLLLPILYPLLTSALHISNKFDYSKFIAYSSAIIVNTLFIFSYYIGRTVGLTHYKFYARS